MLVGGIPIYPSEKYEFVSWDDDIPNKWKNKKCSKPPTSIHQQLVQNLYKLCLAYGKMKLKFKELGHNWDVNGFDQ